MDWQRGLRRLRVVATGAIVVGVVLCASVQITGALGYAPDAGFASLFAMMWPSGLVLTALGALLWVAVWVLQGFAPAVKPTVYAVSSSVHDAETDRMPLHR